MNRHLLYAAVLWLALTAVGEAVALIDFFPVVGAEEAQDSDDAFMLLVYLGVPVLTFVIAGLAYSVLRFRAVGEPTEDGPPIHGPGRVIAAWLAVTGALALLVLITPGFTGLAALREDKPIDLVVEVEGVQWAWIVSYPEYDIRVLDEMVLPVDQRIRFAVTSTDVLHSFWIPAFRQKIDAVPGRTTEVYATPTRAGEYTTDIAYRIQCAELCGLDHQRMTMPVRVVSEEEFEAWVASKQK